jgi:hydroxymethylbilane synthase
LSETGDKRLFVKEIEDALLAGDVDIAVHSAKDMSATLPDGLEIAAVLPREDPRDALVLHAADGPRTSRRRWRTSARVPRSRPAASGGSRSSRRCSRCEFRPVRGNVDTRLRKLDEGDSTRSCSPRGLRRLGLRRISAAIPFDVCIPPPARASSRSRFARDDPHARVALQSANDAAAAVSLEAERTVVTALGGGCQLPLGAIALHGSGGLTMHGVVATPDGKRAIRGTVEGSTGDPAGLGLRLAEKLARSGAQKS